MAQGDDELWDGYAGDDDGDEVAAGEAEPVNLDFTQEDGEEFIAEVEARHAGTAVLPKPQGTAEIDSEIKAIEDRMRTDRRGYFKDAEAQARYGELLEQRQEAVDAIRVYNAVTPIEAALAPEALEAFADLPETVHWAVRDGLLADEDWQGKLGRMEAWLSDEDLEAAHQWLLTLSAEEREMIVAALGGP